MEIKTVDQFCKKLIEYYTGCGTEKQVRAKAIRIKNGLTWGNYKWDDLYTSVTSQNFFGKFPSWDEIKELAALHRIIEKKYVDLPGQVQGLNGEWVCKDCRGKQGFTFIKNKNGHDYTYFESCKLCKGEGQCIDNNIFIPYEMDRQLDIKKILAELDKQKTME